MKFFIHNPNEIRNMIHYRKYYFQGKELENKLKEAEAIVNRDGYDI